MCVLDKFQNSMGNYLSHVLILYVNNCLICVYSSFLIVVETIYNLT